MLREMKAADYHAEKDMPICLSQSMAHILVSQSPAHAYRAHPKLGGKAREATAAMGRGTVIHDLLLNSGRMEGVEVLDYDSFRSSAAREERELILASGGTLILRKDFDDLANAADHLRVKLQAAGISFPGQTEGVALWEERDDEGRVVHCRARLDHWHAPQIDDLKTTACAHPRSVTRSIFEHGYDLQCAAYLSAMEKLHPELAGRVRFRFVFVELAEPYLITPVELDGSVLAIGRSKWRRALNIWSNCIRTGEWGGYVSETYRASASPWHIREELELTADSASLVNFLD